MTAEASFFVGAVVVGLGATLFMDLCALFLKMAFGIPSASYCLVGRWIAHMPDGTFMHANIASAPSKRAECAVGWTAHYAIGAMYALVFVAFVSSRWLAHPTFFPAIIFGIVSVVVPYLIMQPSFGLGIAASKTPHPTQARLRSLMAHTAFGVGLYASAVAVSYVLRPYA